MAKSNGKLIVIEGIEGAGKSSAMNTILSVLAEHGINTITTREPGGTAIGELLRSIIINPEYAQVLEDRSELLLFYVSRIQLLEQVIKPALAEGTWVVADRFELSTQAYQGGGRGLDQAFIKTLSQFCLNDFAPDLILYLDISPEMGIERIKSRGQFDRIEQQSIDFFHKVHAAYAKLIQGQQHVLTIDATQPLEDVQATIKSKLHLFIEQQQ